MLKIIRRVVLSAFLSSIIPSGLWADPSLVVTPEPASDTLSSAATLPEVVVTANRLNTPVSQIANSMTVITAKDIEQKQAGTALEALQGVLGLTLFQNGAAGQSSGIFMRGADAGHTLVLMNGVPLNNPISTSREFDYLDQLSNDDISQVEVVRGPMSSIYGTNATAGVVNIITRKMGNGPQGSFLFEGGAYQSFREAATASAGNDLGNFDLSVSRFDTQGFPSADKNLGNSVNSLDGNTSASLRVGVLPSSEMDNSFFARYSQAHTNLPAFGGSGGDDPNFFLDERLWVSGTQSKWDIWKDVWEQSLSLSFTDDLQKFTDDLSSYANSHFERGVYEGQGAQVSWQNDIHPWKEETLVAGLQEQQEWGRVDDTTDYGYGLSQALIQSTATTGSYFLESQTTLLDRFFMTLGGRLDAVSSFGSQVTYRAAAAYFVPGLETKIKGSYGTGFTAPSLYQLYSPYGDPNLKAENSQGWDVGVEQSFTKTGMKMGATYFHNSFTNLIDFDPNTFLYNNIGSALTEGWELFFSAKPLPGLECRADYTYTWAVNLDTGDQLVRRPQDKADLSLGYQQGPGSVGFSFLYVGDRPDVAFTNFTSTPKTLAAYALVNLTTSYALDDHFKLFGRMDNLFNTQYEEVYGYGTPGLSVYVGTKVSL